VYLDRDAWEMLPPDGVLLMRVEPAGGPPFVLALTADELEAVFGEVRATASWRDARCYHFPTEPPAARAFVVNIGGTDSEEEQLKARIRELERVPVRSPTSRSTNAPSTPSNGEEEQLQARIRELERVPVRSPASGNTEVPPANPAPRLKTQAGNEKPSVESTKTQRIGKAEQAKRAARGRKLRKKYPILEEGSTSVRTVSGGFETNRRRH
jgi:hypothetical protein